MGRLRAAIACVVALAACRPSNLTKIEAHGSDGGVTSFCGNGIVEPGEVCDPPGPHCSPDCKSDLSCGNFIVDTEAGEVCDDGHTTTCEHCSDDCKSDLSCGNKIVDACKGEQCDDGTNALDGACPSCQNAYCGDGLVWAGQEQCDDGTNALDGACPGCQNAYCGDGYVWKRHEQCDNGANNSASAYGVGACTDQCQTAPYCGDGNVDANFGEECDNGANNGNDGICDANCQCVNGAPC